MEISSIVRVVITRGNKSITRAGFGTPMIVTNEASAFGNEVRTYTSLDALAEDFLTSTSTYKWAARLFGQERKPRRIKVGKQTSKVSQVVTITPNVDTQEVFEYVVTIDGTEYAFTGDGTPSAAEIVTGLTNLINADDDAKVTASGTTTLVLTADTAGRGFSYSAGERLTAVLTTPNNGLQEDLAAIKDIDNDWYMLLLTSRNEYDILNGAEWIETQRKMFLACSDDADVITNATDDIASQLKALGYTRTAYLFSKAQASGPEAAWAGGVLPLDPGSETWKFKTLAGVTTDDLTSSQEGYADGKNANVYLTVGGVGITAEGKVAMGEYIDVIRFIDWLQAQIEEGVFERLVSLPKIPFTNNGVALIEERVRNALERGVRAGGLSNDPAPEVTVPDVADVSTQDKQSRTLPDVNFNGQLAGAIHFTDIEGVVQV